MEQAYFFKLQVYFKEPSSKTSSVQWCFATKFNIDCECGADILASERFDYWKHRRDESIHCTSRRFLVQLVASVILTIWNCDSKQTCSYFNFLCQFQHSTRKGNNTVKGHEVSIEGSSTNQSHAYQEHIPQSCIVSWKLEGIF